MRLLVIALLVTGCSKGKEQRVCEHGAKLCDAADELPDCATKLKDLKDVMGDAYGKSLDCAQEAKSCAEFAGCFVGGLGAGLEEFEKQFGRGVDKVMKKDRHGGDHHGAASGVLDGCKSFESGDKSAHWFDCEDGVRRDVVCEKFIDDLRCDCREDGVHTWSFHATDPPLDARDSATRIASANCKMGFGN
jgi:hypothetical protein